MKCLAITILVTLLITGCSQRTDLQFISTYHKYAVQCGDAIKDYNNNDIAKLVMEKSCQHFSQHATNFDKAMRKFMLKKTGRLEKSQPHQAMLSDIMEIGFQYSTLTSPENQKLVVLTSPNVVRMVFPPK